jgi:hypothetical protein
VKSASSAALRETVTKRPGLFLFLLCLALYGVSIYGGARSPDAEAVVSGAEALLRSGTMGATEHPVLKSAGFAIGQDGLYYPVFGPALSLALVPALAMGQTLGNAVPDSWASYAPANLYLTNGYAARLADAPLAESRAHWSRLPAALMNAIFAALAALVFWQALLWLKADRFSAAVATGLLAFAGPLWPYSQTMFSEPLALLATLVSFAALSRLANSDAKPTRPLVWAAVSGLALGLATAAHLSAVLFAPFLGLWLMVESSCKPQRLAISVIWIAGLGVFLLALGALNAARFGDILETGRTVDPESARIYGFGVFVAPWKGLYGLLFSSAKGLLIYAPATLIGLALLPKLSKTGRLVTLIMWGAVVLRIVFIAARSDWHGGFSPGPRYLMLAYPFLLLPVAFVDWRSLAHRSRLAIWAFAALALVVQAELVTGDLIVFFFQARERLLHLGLSLDEIFAHAALYTDWRVSPLINLHVAPVAPMLARLLGLGFASTWLLLTTFAGGLFYWWVRVAGRSNR